MQVVLSKVPYCCAIPSHHGHRYCTKEGGECLLCKQGHEFDSPEHMYKLDTQAGGSVQDQRRVDRGTQRPAMSSQVQ